MQTTANGFLSSRIQPAILHPRAYEMGARFRAYLFGEFAVQRDGELIICAGAKRNNKCTRLLKWFLLNPGIPFSSEELVERLWPAADRDQAIGNFHVTMHRLRRTLEPDLRPRRESSYLLRSAGNFYHFDGRGTWWTDTSDLELLFELGQASEAEHRPVSACFFYGRIAEYGIRGFLADESPDAEWSLGSRRHYESLYLHALVRLVEIHAEAGRPEAATEYAYRLHAIDPEHPFSAESVETELIRAETTGQAALRPGPLVPEPASPDWRDRRTA